MTSRKQFAEALGLELDVVAGAERPTALEGGAQSILVAALTALGGWVSGILMMAAFGSVLAMTGEIAVPGILFVLFGLYLRKTVTGILGQQMGAALILAGIPTIAFGFENLGGLAWLNFGLAVVVALTVLLLERGGYLLALLVAYALVSFWGATVMDSVKASQAATLFGTGMPSANGINPWPSLHLLLCLVVAGTALLSPWRGMTLQPMAFASLLAALVAAGYGEFERIFWGSSGFAAGTWLVHGTVEFMALFGLVFWAKRQMPPRLVWGLFGTGLLFCFVLPGAGGIAFLMMVAAYVTGWRSLGITGFIGALWAVSRFYYALDFTLLEKAGMMILVGVALLALNRWLHGHHGGEAADAKA